MNENMLKVFSVTKSKHTIGTYRHKLLDLTGNEDSSALFEWYKPLIYAPGNDVTAVFLASRISRFAAFVHWAAASGHSCDFQSVFLSAASYRKREPIFTYHVPDFETFHDSSHQARLSHIQYFYQRVLSPVFQQWSAIAGLPNRELWGQLYYQVPHFLELASARESDRVKHLLEKDWNYIKNGDPGKFFLEKQSPLHFHIRPILNPVDNSTTYTKPVCCLNYKRAKQPYCYKCPRLTPEQRQEFYHAYGKKL
ncbi:hypothetical protein [Bacillus sp. FJAT-44742]|uniref:hypothetical protein n=1 Tax=Bacillus sp. FJAT-44742 TaxID=2014005 RepID=UPI000C23C7ED|nr:hypothetical protein [Bacillus sp. FJAT-44742]